MAEVKEYTTEPRRLTLDEMKQFLWGAAVRLRGQIDAAGYKEYIFPLLFFKRISDVYDEQYDGYVAEGGEEYANMQVEDFAIKIPDGAHWRDVRAVTENVGQRLVEAFIAIEQVNPGVHTDGRVVGGLEGIFGPKDIWTNKNKMPDHIITSLIEDFSRYNLSIAACPADEMGQAYEYLVGKFADDAGNTAQEFYTNRTVVTLMAEILKPKPGESIYDPTCGSGGMLVKCLDYLREKGEAWQSVKVFGQEINALTSSIARMNLYLNGVEDFSIVREDTLKYPAFVDGSKLRTFDVVLANPPYSIKAWDRDAFANDKWGRNFLGTPPQGRADYAFLQHIIASMNEKTGRCAILFPHGILARDEESEMRAKLIPLDVLECVIGIGRNLFYNSPMEACVVICNNNKDLERKNKVLFIDAHNLVTRKNGESFLEPQHIDEIVGLYKNFQIVPGLSSIVTIDKITGNNSLLSIQLYVRPKKEDSFRAFDDNYNIWESCHTSALANFSDLLNVLREESHPLVFQNKNFYLEYPAHYLISINSHAGDGETMASILHELGHFFCHHLISPPGQKEWWQSRNLPHDVMEFEAESVAWLICQRIGLQSPSERYLSGYLNANKEIPAGVSIEAIFKAADNVWKMVSTIITYDKGLLYKHDKRFKEKLKTVIDSHKNSKQTQKPQSLFD